MEDNTPLESVVLKIPILQQGTFVHKVYGIVSFNQQDIDDIIRNFQSNELGFIPYIRYGHAKYSNAIDAEPSIGRIFDIVYEMPYLFAYCTPDTPEIVEEIKGGQYRYASGEFTRNDISKKTGIPIGTTLSCLALTNAPYLPDLPESIVLSESLRPDCEGFFVLDLGGTADSETASPIHKLSTLVTSVLDKSKPESKEELSDMLDMNKGGMMMSSDAEDKEKMSSSTPEETLSNKEPEMMSNKEPEMMSNKDPEALSNDIMEKMSNLPPEFLKKVKDKLSSLAWVEGDRGVASMEANTGENTTFPKEGGVELQDEQSAQAVSKVMSKMAEMEKFMSEALSNFNSSMEKMSSKVGGLEEENKGLKAKLSTASAQSQQFSNMLTEQKLNARCSEAMASGIPSGMVQEVRDIVASGLGSSTIKLSNGEQVSLEDKLFNLLEAMPHAQRVQFTQVGQQLSHTPAENPYKEIISKNIKK